MSKWQWIGIGILSMALLGCATTEIQTVVVTATPEVVATVTPNPDTEATIAAAVQETVVAIPTATTAPTSTPLPSPTSAPAATPIPTPTPTNTPVPTATPEPTNTPVPTATPEPTNTPTPVPSATPGLPTPTPGPSAAFGEGVYIVGVDILPGTYRNAGTASCYWARLSGFSGSLDDIIANSNVDGPAVVTIQATDTGFESTRCGTWALIQSVSSTLESTAGPEQSIDLPYPSQPPATASIRTVLDGSIEAGTAGLVWSHSVMPASGIFPNGATMHSAGDEWRYRICETPATSSVILDSPWDIGDSDLAKATFLERSQLILIAIGFSQSSATQLTSVLDDALPLDSEGNALL